MGKTVIYCITVASLPRVLWDFVVFIAHVRPVYTYRVNTVLPHWSQDWIPLHTEWITLVNISPFSSLRFLYVILFCVYSKFVICPLKIFLNHTIIIKFRKKQNVVVRPGIHSVFYIILHRLYPLNSELLFYNRMKPSVFWPIFFNIKLDKLKKSLLELLLSETLMTSWN